MNEKIKQEAAHAMRLIGILNVNGDAVHGSAREERKRGPG